MATHELHSLLAGVVIVKSETDEEFRKELRAWIARPEYERLIGKLGAAMTEWKHAHPHADLRWVEYPKTTVVTGEPSGGGIDALAVSDDAKSCLRHADHVTKREASLLTLQLALRGLGWTP